MAVAVVVVITVFIIAPNNMQNPGVAVAEGDCFYKQQPRVLQCKELCLFLESYNTTI